MDLTKKINELVAERETIVSEMKELQTAFDTRNTRLVELTGSLKTLGELVDNEKKENEISEQTTIPEVTQKQPIA